MANYNRDSQYLHPLLRNNLKTILHAIHKKLPAGISAKVISIHRTPAEQFDLYKKGRIFNPATGKWERTGEIVTTVDGYVKKSRHNYLPATALDIGLFQNGKYLTDSIYYKHIEAGAKVMNFTWGGNWTSIIDRPHIEIPQERFWQSIEKDIGRVWQAYLSKDGTYTGALDGIFGARSLEALRQSTGQIQRNVAAWDVLYNKYERF